MKPQLDIPPRTIMEVYKMLPEGTLAEVIENQIYMSPSPSFDHQDILIEIASQLRNHLKGRAKVAVAPFDIYLDESKNAVQPDIVVILNSSKGILNRKGHFHGVPEFVIEILSQGNRDYDLIRKKDLYQKFGVQEYWIVDPDTKLAMGFVLENNQYALKGEEIGTINSELIGLRVSF
jgi:Uma2 family endonuclease